VLLRDWCHSVHCSSNDGDCNQRSGVTSMLVCSCLCTYRYLCTYTKTLKHADQQFVPASVLDENTLLVDESSVVRNTGIKSAGSSMLIPMLLCLLIAAYRVPRECAAAHARMLHGALLDGQIQARISQNLLA
jgi:hypothetical protein